MQKSLVVLFRLLPIPVMYALMGVVIPFYMIVNHREYLAAYRFFRIRMGRRPLRAFLDVYANEFMFGQVVLDRFAVFAGRRFHIRTEGLEAFEQRAREADGLMILSAHVGHYEMSGYSLHAPKRFHVLVFGEETEHVMAGRQALFDRMGISMIPVRQNDLSHIFRLNEALRDGDIVSIPADRIFGSRKIVRAPFFGQEAAFPKGPFELAALRDVPVLTIFVLKEGLKRYCVRIEPLQADAAVPAREKADALARAYAQRLEATVRAHPLQWYNFYDFWQ